MKTNLSNFKWIVLPLMLLTFAVSNVKADVNDLSISTVVAADSVVVAPDSVQSAISWSDKFDQVLDNHRFLFGIIASGIAAILVLFVFFAWLRPRFEIMPIVAKMLVLDKKTEKLKIRCQIAIRNKSFFPCNDLRIEIKHVGKNKSDEEGTKPIDDKHHIQTIKGRLRNENVSVQLIEFDLPDKGIPTPMRVSILSQLSVSGIVMGIDHTFTALNFEDGHYEHGLFVPAGNTYKQSLMRMNRGRLKWINWITPIVFALFASALYIFTNISFTLFLIILCCSILVVALIIILWQLYIYTKADAYSIGVAHHTFERIERQVLLGFFGSEEDKKNLKKYITSQKEVEEAEAETLDTNNDKE